MALPSDLQFLGIAARIRKALNASKDSEAANAASLEERAPKNDDDFDEPGVAQSGTSAGVDGLDYLFNETDVRVSSTTIEFGKFTYVLKHLASTNRINKVPPRIQYQMGIVLTLVALLIVIIYIFTGRVTFGWAAVVYLVAGLSAFIISLLAYWNLKSSYTLVFKDAGGSVIQSVMRRDKAVIDRLEKAVKLAVSRNNKHID